LKQFLSFLTSFSAILFTCSLLFWLLKSSEIQFLEVFLINTNLWPLLWRQMCSCK